MNAVLNILSIYINFRLINFFLEKRERKKSFMFLIYCLTWLFNWGIYYLYSNVHLTSASLFILLLIATIMLYKGSLLRKIAAALSSVALGIVVDDIVWCFFSYFDLLEQMELFANLIVSLILIVLILLLEHFFGVDKNNYVAKKSYINIALVRLGNVFLINILIGIAPVERLEVMIALIIICLSDMRTFWLYNKVNEVYSEKLECQMMEEQISMYKRQFQIVQQSQKKIQSLQHDMKKHLYLVNVYLEKENYQAAKSYISEIENYIDVPEQYVNTGNQELDAILYL